MRSAQQSESRYKAEAQSYLAEAKAILRQLAADRVREERQRRERQGLKRQSILSEVKAILQPALLLRKRKR